jgi:hypothetical protein
MNNTESPYHSKPLPPLPLSALSQDSPNLLDYGPDANVPCREFALHQAPPRRPWARKARASFQSDGHMLPLPELTEEEIAITCVPPTPMEELELDNGMFGSAPLEVNGGVAVMEESVDFRVADVVTQF